VLKVLQIPYCFMPDPIGGTEVYVHALAQELSRRSVRSVIAAPGTTTHAYTLGDLRVRRFAVSPSLNLREVYGLGDSIAAEEFEKLLDDETPDLIHMHALSPAISVQLVRLVKAREIPTILTYHTPTVTCQRGTMMRWGQDICDGSLNVAQCAPCVLQSAGLPRLVAEQVGRLPPAVGRWLGEHRLQGGIWTALRMTDLVRIRHETFRELASGVDHFVAVCNWVHDVLRINGIPAEKISLSRQGINLRSEESKELEKFVPSDPAGKLRLAFVGRFDATKGLHVLIDAIRVLPELNVVLDVFGIGHGQASEEYRRKMIDLADGDNRINFCMPIRPDGVISRLRQYDFLAVPSQWLETGPLVVLEAFAAGTPVLGSAVGGLKEIVRDGVDGLLIELNKVNGWGDTLCRLAQSTEMRAKLRRGVRPPRTSREVADDMVNIYERVLAVRRNGETWHRS